MLTAEDWSDKYGAGSSELSDADADALKLPQSLELPECVLDPSVLAELMLKKPGSCKDLLRIPSTPLKKKTGVTRTCRWTKGSLPQRPA